MVHRKGTPYYATPAYPGVSMPQPSILHRCIIPPRHATPLKYPENHPFTQLLLPRHHHHPKINPSPTTINARTRPKQSFSARLLSLPTELRHQIYNLLLYPWTQLTEDRGPIHTPMRSPIALARLLKTPDNLPDISYQAGGRSSTSFYSQRLQEFEWKGGKFDYFSREDLRALGDVEERLVGFSDDVDDDGAEGEVSLLREDFRGYFWGEVVLDLKGEMGGWFVSDWKGPRESKDWLSGSGMDAHFLPFIQNISLDLLSSTVSSPAYLGAFIDLVRFVGEHLCFLKTVHLWVAVSWEEGQRILDGEFLALVEALRALRVRRCFAVGVAVLWIEGGEVGGVTGEEVYEDRRRALTAGLENLLMPETLREEENECICVAVKKPRL